MTRSVFLAAATVLSAAGSGAQSQQSPVFRSSVDLVHFDVSVLDRDRRPVRGLKIEDFKVLEDGKPRTVMAFAAVDVEPPVPQVSSTWRDVSADVISNEPEHNPDGRLFVLLIDDAMLPGDPSAIRNARKIAHGVVDRLSATDQLAVVFSFAGRNGQAFTTDRAKLRSSIDSLQAGAASHLMGWDNTVPFRRPPPLVGTSNIPSPDVPPVPVVDSDIGLRLGSLRTLQMVADTLMAASQRRKALIFLSPGIAVDLESDAKPVQALRGRTDPGTAIREANHQLAREMPAIFGQMARANVTVYSIDPCGLGGLEGYVTGAANGLVSLRNGIRPGSDYNWLAPDNPPLPADLARHAAKLDMDFLLAAAGNTGGRAIVNTNEFETGLEEVFGENSSYYLLGYPRSTNDPPGKVHQVIVKVDRPGVTVRTRSGYSAEPDDRSSGSQAFSALLARAAAGPVASGSLPLRLALAPVAVSNRGEAAVTIVVALRQDRVIERTSQSIELQTGVFTPDGRRLGPLQRQTASFKLVPSNDETIRYELLTQVSVPPGRYEVRVAAARASDNLSGSVYADVIVPDFSKAPLSLSGVWLEANPGPSAVPRDAFATILPLIPTATREFDRSDDVTAFFRIYQGGDVSMAPVAVRVGIIDGHGVTLANAADQIAAARFDRITRSADFRFAVPMRNLSAGRYLLRFELGLGETKDKRDVVFAVR